MKRLAILGSTGSVGRSALEVADSVARGFTIDALAADRNWRALAEQARKYRPTLIALAEAADAAGLRDAVAEQDTEVLAGPGAVEELVNRTSAETVVCAISGMAALPGVLAAAGRGLRLAVASKEIFVAAGRLVMDAAARHNAEIIPIDSEHSAVFQALAGARREEVRKVVLTASGGPFYTTPAEKLKDVTPAEALDHPTWKMGRKVTLDSATLMNKALEIVEAQWMFSLDADQIGVLIHPQAVVHSLVEFTDGALLAQMSVPDMRLPILYALLYPARADFAVARLDLASLGALNFYEPDMERFTALKLAFEVVRRGGTLGAVMNAANERAGSLFLEGRITFDRICAIVETVMSRHTIIDNPSLPEIRQADGWGRQEVMRCI